ncbi:unnamed protein product [marine sediment metagenome]|uniref:Uncharacterized protein n=1 Tax=marine sediment metagenome TaxID=412755 RepID=X0SGT7_9ZZZZ
MTILENKKEVEIGDVLYFYDLQFCILVEVLDVKCGKAEITPVAGIQDCMWVTFDKLYKRIR